jgi:hypothetical protein
MHPCGAPVLRISEVEVLFPTFTTWGAAHQEVQDPVAQDLIAPSGEADVLMDVGQVVS